MDEGSGVRVLDKVATMLTTLETSPLTLTGPVGATGLAHPTTHQLAVALEHYRLVTRGLQGRFTSGSWLVGLASSAAEDPPLATVRLILTRLRDTTGESAQLFRRQSDFRICSAIVERLSGLRDTVSLEVQSSMIAKSAAQILLAWEEPENLSCLLEEVTFMMLSLQQVRRRGWVRSIAEHEPGAASISALVLSPSGKIIAAVSVSGSIERLARRPRRSRAPAMMAAVEHLNEVLRRNDVE